MGLAPERLALKRMTPCDGREDARRLAGVRGSWAPGYPLPDELDVVPAQVDNSHAADPDDVFGLRAIRTLPERVAVRRPAGPCGDHACQPRVPTRDGAGQGAGGPP